MVMKCCRLCKKDLDESLFYVNRKQCKNCYNKRSIPVKLKYISKRYKNDPVFRLKMIVRRHIIRARKLGGQGSKSKSEILGCSYNYFYDWIEYNCILDNLTMDGSTHIDHVLALSKHNNNKWYNLFPLLAKDNLKKSAKEPSKEYKLKVLQRRIDFEATRLFMD